MDVGMLAVFIPLLFVLIVLPLFVRFIVGKLVFRKVEREFLSPIMEELDKSESDDIAFEQFHSFLKGKISSPYMRSNLIKEDVKEILLTVQNAYTKSSSEELSYTFSVSELIKCAFLLMSELDQQFMESRRFKRLANSKISTFRKINRISGYYNIVYEKVPFLKILRKGRVTGKIVRILLIPIIGLPSVFLSILVSLISIFATEIIWRYYYSIILVKTFSYILILYSDRKSQIRDRLKDFSHKEIKEEAEKIEEIIRPGVVEGKSPLYEDAYVLYQRALEEMGINPDKDMDFDGRIYNFNSTSRKIINLLKLPLRAADQYNPFSQSKNEDKSQLFELVRLIASPYCQKDQFFEKLRVIDIFDSLYMLSLLGYSRIMGGSFLLNNVSVDFLLTAKNINDEIVGEMLQNQVPHLKKYLRSWKLYRKGRYLFKAVKRGNALGLALSVTGPIAMEGLKATVRDYLYKRVGRMTLHCFESNYSRKKRLFQK